MNDVKYNVIYRDFQLNWHFDKTTYDTLFDVRKQRDKYIACGYPQENVLIITIINID